MEHATYIQDTKNNFFLSGLNYVSSFLWRTIKQRTYRILTFFVRYPQDRARAYCRYWELEHRIDSAYKKVFKDVGYEVNAFYTSLKDRIVQFKNSKKEKFFSDLDLFENIYKQEKNVVEYLGVQVLYAKQETLKKLIALQKEYLNKIDQNFIRISKEKWENPPIDHLIALRQFNELKIKWHQKFDEITSNMLTASHPKQISELSLELEGFIKKDKDLFASLEKGNPFYDEKNLLCDRLKAETLKSYVQVCVGNCLEENGVVIKHLLAEKLPDFFCVDLARHMDKNESFKEKISAVLMEQLIKMRNYTVWEECLNTLLVRYENSTLLEEMKSLWEKRGDSSYYQKILQYSLGKGISDYQTALGQARILPGRVELLAFALQNKISIRLYSHYFEKSYQDLGSSLEKPNLFFLEGENGLLQKIVTK